MRTYNLNEWWPSEGEGQAQVSYLGYMRRREGKKRMRRNTKEKQMGESESEEEREDKVNICIARGPEGIRAVKEEETADEWE